MEKRNKIIFILIVILTVLVISLCVYYLVNNKNTNLSDAMKFRQEYMELNDKTNSANGKIYPFVNISETNTIKYISDKETVDLLENGTGVIYFGFNYCPWCRTLVPSLTKVAEEKQETIYYLDITSIRSTFVVKDNKLIKSKDGSNNYYKILELLKDYLEDYVIYDEKGNSYNTNEKRLYAPTLISIKDGKVEEYHVGTIESQEDAYTKLNNEQTAELENIIEKLIDSKNNEVCTQNIC